MSPTESDHEWNPPEALDEYRLLQPLGRGAMGRVFLARDTVLDRLVAIKFIAALEPDAVTRERFLVEARAVARLQHPNVVSVFRIGQCGGQPYLVSEYVRGQSLDRRPRPLPHREVLAIARGLASGLAIAHRYNVLHRDIKPANVMLADDGTAKLLDFGMAKLTDSRIALPVNTEHDGHVSKTPPEREDGALDATRSLSTRNVGERKENSTMAVASLTLTGEIVGTPLYMAPELWRGEPATPASDIYSLGVLLYELVVGTPPFHEATWEQLRNTVCTRTPDSILDKSTEVDPRLAAIIERCISRKPELRFASAQELLSALEERVAGAPRISRFRRGLWMITPLVAILSAWALVRGGLVGQRASAPIGTVQNVSSPTSAGLGVAATQSMMGAPTLGISSSSDMAVAPPTPEQRQVSAPGSAVDFLQPSSGSAALRRRAKRAKKADLQEHILRATDYRIIDWTTR